MEDKAPASPSLQKRSNPFTNDNSSVEKTSKKVKS